MNGPPADMYPESHPLRVAAEADALEALPEISADMSADVGIVSLVPDR